MSDTWYVVLSLILMYFIFFLNHNNLVHYRKSTMLIHINVLFCVNFFVKNKNPGMKVIISFGL